MNRNLAERRKFGVRRQVNRGEIVKSYKKLILDVKFREGGVVPVFCPELDYMQNLYVPGTEIWVVKTVTGAVVFVTNARLSTAAAV